MSVKVRIKIDPADKIMLKRNLGKNGKAQQFFSSDVRRISDPYVPFDKGPLKNSAIARKNSIEYIQPYARKQWDSNKGKGLRGKMWVVRAWADKGKQILKSVAIFVGGRT